MTGEAPVMRKNPDGSVDIWYRGWRFRYPANGGKPHFLAEAEIPGDAQPVDSEVRYAEAELRRGDWLIVFEEQGPVAVDMKDRKPPGPVWRFFKPFAKRRR
jgi:hypothetical protein